MRHPFQALSVFQTQVYASLAALYCKVLFPAVVADNVGVVGPPVQPAGCEVGAAGRMPSPRLPLRLT